MQLAFKTPDCARTLGAESAHRAAYVASMAHVELPGNPLVSSHRIPLDQPCKGLLAPIIATHRADAAERFAEGNVVRSLAIFWQHSHRGPGVPRR
jgi:hypothetical protein